MQLGSPAEAIGLVDHDALYPVAGRPAEKTIEAPSLPGTYNKIQ